MSILSILIRLSSGSRNSSCRAGSPAAKRAAAKAQGAGGRRGRGLGCRSGYSLSYHRITGGKAAGNLGIGVVGNADLYYRHFGGDGGSYACLDL